MNNTISIISVTPDVEDVGMSRIELDDFEVELYQLSARHLDNKVIIGIKADEFLLDNLANILRGVANELDDELNTDVEQ